MYVVCTVEILVTNAEANAGIFEIYLLEFAGGVSGNFDGARRTTALIKYKAIRKFQLSRSTHGVYRAAVIPAPARICATRRHADGRVAAVPQSRRAKPSRRRGPRAEPEARPRGGSPVDSNRLRLDFPALSLKTTFASNV